MAVNHEIVQLIGDNQYSMILGDDGASYCDPNFNNYDSCIYDTLFNMTIEGVNCTVPWLPGDRYKHLHWIYLFTYLTIPSQTLVLSLHRLYLKQGSFRDIPGKQKESEGHLP